MLKPNNEQITERNSKWLRHVNLNRISMGCRTTRQILFLYFARCRDSTVLLDVLVDVVGS